MFIHSIIAVAALGFSIDGFEMPNQTIYCAIKFFFKNVCCAFFAAAQEIDGFDKPIPVN